MQINIQEASIKQYQTPLNTKAHSVDGQHHGVPIYLQKAAAFSALLMLSPILLTTIFCILFESRGNCFFKQVRVGKYGRHFNMYKFRSMYLKTDKRYQEPMASDSDREGVCAKYRNDPRITKVGSFIRKYSIDELPQLWNIVKGDMLLIGPRPALVSEVEQYDELALNRLNGLPGLSGLWQVSGRADTDFDTQVRLDDDYLASQSIWVDIKIVLATIPCVLFAKGAY